MASTLVDIGYQVQSAKTGLVSGISISLIICFYYIVEWSVRCSDVLNPSQAMQEMLEILESTHVGGLIL